jgi:sulfur carrier protein ThiS
MEIEVRLFATMQKYLPTGEGEHMIRLRLPEDASVDSALAELSIPRELPRIVILNGRRVREDSPLGPGDVLSVFPVLGGG